MMCLQQPGGPAGMSREGAEGEQAMWEEGLGGLCWQETDVCF